MSGELFRDCFGAASNFLWKVAIQWIMNHFGNLMKIFSFFIFTDFFTTSQFFPFFKKATESLPCTLIQKATPIYVIWRKGQTSWTSGMQGICLQTENRSLAHNTTFCVFYLSFFLIFFPATFLSLATPLYLYPQGRGLKGPGQQQAWSHISFGDTHQFFPVFFGLKPYLWKRPALSSDFLSSAAYYPNGIRSSLDRPRSPSALRALSRTNLSQPSSLLLGQYCYFWNSILIFHVTLSWYFSPPNLNLYLGCEGT